MWKKVNKASEIRKIIRILQLERNILKQLCLVWGELWREKFLWRGCLKAPLACPPRIHDSVMKNVSKESEIRKPPIVVAVIPVISTLPVIAVIPVYL